MHMATQKLSIFTSPTAGARTGTTMRYIGNVYRRRPAKAHYSCHFKKIAPIATRRARSLWGRIRAFAAPRTVSSDITPAGDDYPPLESGEYPPLARLARAGMWTVVV